MESCLNIEPKNDCAYDLKACWNTCVQTCLADFPEGLFDLYSRISVFCSISIKPTLHQTTSRGIVSYVRLQSMQHFLLWKQNNDTALTHGQWVSPRSEPGVTTCQSYHGQKASETVVIPGQLIIQHMTERKNKRPMGLGVLLNNQLGNGPKFQK